MQWYKWLMLAPFPVWISWGAAARVAPASAMDYYPFFWVLNDLGIILFLIGVTGWIVDTDDAEEVPGEPSDTPLAGNGPSH